MKGLLNHGFILEVKAGFKTFLRKRCSFFEPEVFVKLYQVIINILSKVKKNIIRSFFVNILKTKIMILFQVNY